ncbi:MAG: TIGR03067 domain-containing protein [Gemmataceae bacterium]|nr:TIGR03067 domain-containing protein [Gemmataceae bacterium]
MSWQGVLLLLAVGLLGPTAWGQDKDKDKDKDEAIKKDQQNLQGTWKVVAAEAFGKPVPLPAGNLMIRFDGDRFIPLLNGKEEKEQGTFTLDPTQKPPHLDLSLKGDKGMRTDRAVYSLMGDDLKIASMDPNDSKAAASRPTSFDTKNQPGVILLTLKRAKK